MTVPVAFNAFDFLISSIEERDTMTWNTAAAKIAEKKHNFSQKFGVNQWEDDFLLFYIYQIVGLDRNPPPIMSYSVYIFCSPYLLTGGKDDCQNIQISDVFLRILTY